MTANRLITALLIAAILTLTLLVGVALGQEQYDRCAFYLIIGLLLVGIVAMHQEMEP